MIPTGLVLLLGCLCHMNALRPEEVVVVVISQGDIYHSMLARDLRTSLHQQSSSLGAKGPKVYLTHEDFPHPGVWTFFPIILRLPEMVKDDILWVIFCEEKTRFNLEKLISVLTKYDPSQTIWLGHGLYDKEPTIRHHFRIAPKMPYPLLASGFAMSMAMIKSIYIMPKNINTAFSIDSEYELALLVRNTSLLSLPSTFCLENNHTECATYPLPFIPCGEPVPNEDIYFVVKTCLNFHKERVPVIQNTWGKEVTHIEFFSDVQDESIPTTPVGVPNTDRGHCAKFKKILETALKRTWKFPNLQWIVLADDDTLLSVPRLRQLLSCWPEQPVVVGERYGYEVFARIGYNYHTGGAGIAINTAVLPTLEREFHCFSDDAPDDMVFGSLLTQLGIPNVHSPLFHQARPVDYAFEYLAVQPPISFHKFREVDPFTVYEQWFSPTLPKSSKDTHTEL